MTDINPIVLLAIEAALAGGNEIMKIYDTTEVEVHYKNDDSPLTLADKNAHLKIKSFLEKTNIPILSEEGKHENFETRKQWTKLWIVDPLDGTKEFVKRNGEFTVNIALIENNRPIEGVIYVPVQEILYFTNKGKSYKIKLPITTSSQQLTELLSFAQELPNEKNEVFTIVASRSHPSAETEEYIKALEHEHGTIGLTSIGSSLKICLVAEGTAHVYPRFAPTMEWDTAAGHAILIGAGKELIDYETEKPMLYNREQLRNNWFIAK
jgi:3'(2'), 5'-bisphosphate nucleotidase